MAISVAATRFFSSSAADAVWATDAISFGPGGRSARYLFLFFERGLPARSITRCEVAGVACPRVAIVGPGDPDSAFSEYIAVHKVPDGVAAGTYAPLIESDGDLLEDALGALVEVTTDAAGKVPAVAAVHSIARPDASPRALDALGDTGATRPLVGGLVLHRSSAYFTNGDTGTSTLVRNLGATQSGSPGLKAYILRNDDGDVSAPLSTTTSSALFLEMEEVDQAVQPLTLNSVPKIAVARDGGAMGDIAVSGVVDGGPVALEYRLVDADAVVAGHDWAPLVATSVDGAFAAMVSGVPVGGGRTPSGSYRIEVRRQGDAGTTVSTNGFGVGWSLVLAGQSNMARRRTVGSLIPTALGRQTLDGTGQDELTGEGHVAMADAFADATGVPLLLYNIAVGGSGIGEWTAASAIAPGYDALLTAIEDVGAAAVLWNQGERESQLSYALTAEGHRAELSALADDLRADAGRPNLPFVVEPVLFTESAAYDPARLSLVREGQGRFADDDPANWVGASSPDLTATMPDGIHPVSYRLMSERGVATLIHALTDLTPVRRGPVLASVDAVSATETMLSFVHGGGSALVPDTALAGFTLTDATGPVTVTDAQVVGPDKVRLTHDLASGERTVRYLANVPDLSALLGDDLGWMVEPEMAGRSSVVAVAIGPEDGLVATTTRGAALSVVGRMNLVPIGGTVALTASGARLWVRQRWSLLPEGGRLAILTRGAGVSLRSSDEPRARAGRTWRPMREGRVTVA
ncbi:MAG: sialate O-acetylesterase [Pacificimonas sp.]